MVNSKSLPKVTIAVLSYNTGNYVVNALDSIIQQKYPNMEIIIIDDCSKDDSVSLINNWIAVNTTCNYKFIIHSENRGQTFGLNEILSIATGKYISFIGDDIFVPEKTTEQVKMLEEAGADYGVAYGNMSYIDEAGNSLGDGNWFDEKFCKDYNLPQGDIFSHIIYSTTFFCQASLYNMDVLRRINFRFDNRFISEDWHLNLFITRYSKAIGSYKVYCQYRYRSDSVTAVNWTEEKMYRVLLSQFSMFHTVHALPENTPEDKEAIYQKMHALALQLYSSDKLTKVKKANIAFALFKLSPSFKNLVKCIMLLFHGNLNVASNTTYQSVKNKASA